MNILKLGFRNFCAKPLDVILSIILLSFSVALISFTFQLQKGISDQINNNTSNIDMIIGAKGSPLQLILSSVLHIDDPTGNINFSEAKKILKNPLISKSVPLSYGDNFQGYRIVGTTKEFLQLYDAAFASGREFLDVNEVVLGAKVQEKVHLKVGDSILSSHGLVMSDDIHEHHYLEVVGILQPTNSIIDNLVITPLTTVWDVHNHPDENIIKKNNHSDIDHIHKNDKEVTSILVQFRNPMGFVRLPRKINEDTNMQAALTKFELQRLYNLTAVGIKILRIVAYLILFISIISILISLVKIVKERRYELALIRVYGAKKYDLIFLVFIEGLLVCLSGFLLGIILSRMIGFFVFDYINKTYNYILTQYIFTITDLSLLAVVFGLLIFSILIVLIPVFKLNVSKTLRNER